MSKHFKQPDVLRRLHGVMTKDLEELGYGGEWMRYCLADAIEIISGGTPNSISQ